MSGVTITLTANDTARTATTLLDGTGTDALKLISADYGNPQWSTTYSGPRGTQGARAAGSTPGNRDAQFTFTTTGAASFTAAAQRLAGLANTVEMTRRHGGTLTIKHANQAHRHHLRVLAGTIRSGSWSNKAERGRLEASLAFTAAPYIEGDPLGATDQFVTDTTVDYTFDQGQSSYLTHATGALTVTTAAQSILGIHTATGVAPGDMQTTVRAVPVGLTGTRYAGAVVKRVAAQTCLIGRVSDSGSASSLELVRMDSGAVATVSTTGLTRITAGVPFHVTCRVEGNVVYVEYWAPGNPPSLAGTATTTITYVLSGSEVTTFGEGTTGPGGFWAYTSAVTGDRIEMVETRPFVYRGANLAGTAKLPGHYRLDGVIPGDAPALATIDVGVVPESSDTTSFGMLAWARRAPTWNMVTDPGFEWYTAAIARQWSVASVTGVTGAATSITQTAGGRFGLNCAEIVTPATANRGVSCELTPPGGFRAGVTYTAEVWVRAASSTTNTRLRLGVSGDIASETAAALTTSWVRRTVTWTPTATVTQAYLAFEVTAATATTMQLDAAAVYEGTTAPTLQTQRDGNGGLPPFGVLEGHAAASITGFATGTGSAYLNSRRLVVSSGSSASAEWVLDPALIPPTRHSETLDVEVWAGVENGTSGTTVTTTIRSLSSAGLGQTTYTREWGATARSLGQVNGLVRLGTVPLVPSGDVPLPQRLVTDWAWTTTGGGLTLNYLLLVIPSQRLASPTGKSDTAYPVFANTATSRPITRRVLPDGRGQTSGALSGVWATAPALVGQLIEPDAGDVQFVATVARHIPDTAGGAVLATWRYGGLAVNVTPRWHVVRDTA